MRIDQALDFLHASNAAQFESLSDLIPNELITTLLGEEGVATLRRRRMPMERLVWAIIGMAIFRHVPMTQLVNQLDILLPGDRPFVAPSAFLQARQKLGDKSIERLFHETASLAPAGQSSRLGRAATARRRWRDVAHPRYPGQCRRLCQTRHPAWGDRLSAGTYALSDGAHQPSAHASRHGELRRQLDGEVS